MHQHTWVESVAILFSEADNPAIAAPIIVGPVETRSIETIVTARFHDFH